MNGVAMLSIRYLVLGLGMEEGRMGESTGGGGGKEIRGDASGMG